MYTDPRPICQNTESISVHMFHFVSYFLLSTPCIFLESIHAPTNELNTIPFITIIKTTTCFGTGVTSSRIYTTKSISQIL